MIDKRIIELSSTMDKEEWNLVFYGITQQAVKEYIVKRYHEGGLLKDITLGEFLNHIETSI